MLNQLLKFTLVSSLLLWLKPRWKSLLALTVAVAMVHVFHGEYLNYVQLSGNDAYLVWSYVIKWLVLLVVAGIYLSYLVVGTRPARGTSSGHKGSSVKDPVSERVVDDGFDFIRSKKRLQNRADKVIESREG